MIAGEAKNLPCYFMVKRAFTLLEILISLILISIAALGGINLFMVSKKLAAHNQARMAGGEIGKFFLEPLMSQVGSGWDNAGSGLRMTGPGTFLYCDNDPVHAALQHPNCPSAAQRRVNNIPYESRYNITSVAVGDNTRPRRVVMDLNWNEINP